MRAYLAFTQKEFLESLRTYKLLIMFMVFLLFGMLGPLTAKLTPQLLEAFVPEGIQIIMAEPTALDSWAHFFKNISQMGFMVLAILLSGMMANEHNRGTFVNILTKGLPRRTVILSKFTAASVIWTVSYVICFSLSYVYTAYFWSGEGILNLPFSVFCLWLFGILLLAVILLGGVISRNSYGCLMFAGGFIVILFLLNIVPKFQKYNPLTLVSLNMSLLTGNTVPKDLTAPLIISVAIVILFIIIAIGVFNKKQI
jgi:hypothetical protein